MFLSQASKAFYLFKMNQWGQLLSTLCDAMLSEQADALRTQVVEKGTPTEFLAVTNIQ